MINKTGKNYDILILNWKDIRNPEVGGAEIILYEFAKRLVKEGHKVTWFCRRFRDCVEREAIDGIEIIRRGNKLSTYFEAWRYYKSLTSKPDKVIDSINTICWQTPLYVDQKRRFAYVNQLAKEVFFYELPQPFSSVAYHLEHWEYKTYKTTRFLCYSKSVKEDLGSFGIPLKNISIFSLGLDHNRYIKGRKSKEPLFVFVARLVRMKRADLCVEAIKHVREKHKKARLAIVGYGPQEEDIKKLINKYGLDKNVLLVNKDNLYFEKNEKDSKVKLLQKAWALLLPSVKEGWGMVVTEAAACGTPSIVTDVTGLRDSVIDGRTGFIVSADPTIEELVNCILKIIDNKSLRKELEMNAVKWANNFSWETSFREFKNILDI